MNLIDKWKRRKTKKKLREENIRLKTLIESNTKVQRIFEITEQKSIQNVRFSMEIKKSDLDKGIPDEFIKKQLSYGILEYIMPFIKFDFSDSIEGGGKICTANIYVTVEERDDNL